MNKKVKKKGGVDKPQPLCYTINTEKKGEKKMIKVVFGLNYAGCDEIVEFEDDVTEEEISETYEQWLQEQGTGWYYYED